MVRDGRVLRSWKDGAAKIGGFLEDHAALALGAIALYQLTFDRMWLDRARALGDEIIARFWDEEREAFFDTASDGEPLVTRPREPTDNAIPSGTSLAVELLLMLGDVFGESELTSRASRMLETVAEPMARYPTAFGHALGALDLAVRGAIEVAVVGDPSDAWFVALTNAVATRYVPSLVMAGGPSASSDGIAVLAGRGSESPMAYLCRNYACESPTASPEKLRSQLDAIRPTA
jgi:uncharacterized protein YyaL (SSP411 family)